MNKIKTIWKWVWFGTFNFEALMPKSLYPQWVCVFVFARHCWNPCLEENAAYTRTVYVVCLRVTGHFLTPPPCAQWSSICCVWVSFIMSQPNTQNTPIHSHTRTHTQNLFIYHFSQSHCHAFLLLSLNSFFTQMKSQCLPSCEIWLFHLSLLLPFCVCVSE